MRTKEIIEKGAKTVATACPFCLTMIEDGLKEMNKTDAVQTKDLAELVAERLSTS
jgi:Fe-S oxidoreductase